MSEEASAPSSIAERIAALKLNQVGRVPGAQPVPKHDSNGTNGVNGAHAGATNGQRRPPPPPPPARPALPDRPQSTNNPPVHDQATSANQGIGNQPNQPRQVNGASRPPLPSRPSQNAPSPALPPRRPSEQASPALPPRRPSEGPILPTRSHNRRDSNESVSSVATGRSSLSGTSNATSLASLGGTSYNRVRAPEYDPASLPKLPPNRTKEEKEADARKYAGLRPLRQTKSSPKVDPLGKTTTPPPAPRPAIKPPPVNQPPPYLPSRQPSRQNDIKAIEPAPPQQPPRPQPPPWPQARPELAEPPRPRQSALNFGLNKSTSQPPPLPGARPGSVPQTNGVPPPIPTASKPDLAALQASKPKMNGAAAVSAASPGTVVELTPQTFDNVVFRSGKPTLVDFYAPWCGPCKEFAPTYEELARQSDSNRVTIAKFDHGNNREIGDRYGVNSWPTLLWFDGKGNEPFNYASLRRGRNIESLTDFILDRTGGYEATPLQPSAVAAGVCMICRDFSAPDEHAARFPRESIPSQDVGWLAQQLTAPFSSPTDKARAIFKWCHYNIAYNTTAFFSGNIKPSTPGGTIASGLAVCEGYAGLYCALALKAGLECMVLSGASKGFGYEDLQPGQPIPPYKMTHAWNAVRIDNGEWKLIDSCWGAGNVSDQTKTFNKVFAPQWFTMTNDEFGLSHFPPDAHHQFRDHGAPPLSWEEYSVLDKHGLDAKITFFGGAFEEEGFDKRTVTPKTTKISPRDQPGPTIRFSWQKACPHWDPLRHGRGPYYIYALALPETSGAKQKHIPFETNGDVWWCDVPVADLGNTPGSAVNINAMTQWDGKDGRGLSIEQFRRQTGRVGWAGSGVARWEIA